MRVYTALKTIGASVDCLASKYGVTNLSKLIRNLRQSSFNGARYDHVILAPYILKSAYTAAPRLRRRGNSIISINIKGLVYFKDITFLLSPGLSLSKFAANMGLKELSKALFPYELVDESMDFLDQAQLPEDPQLYRSDLTEKLPTLLKLPVSVVVAVMRV